VTATVTPLPSPLIAEARAARAGADAMAEAGYSNPYDAAAADDLVWKMAASVAKAPAADRAFRVAVVAVLRDRAGRT
jgi:hypothetical protein